MTADAAALERALVELLTLERELAEISYVRRADALERVAEAVRRLGDLPGGGDLPARAAAELGQNSEFGRVVISEIRDAELRAVAAWQRDGHGDELLDRLRAEPLVLSYPLREHDVASTHVTRIVDAGGGRRAHAWERLLSHRSYAIAPLVADLETIGLIHLDDGGRGLDELDLEVAREFAGGLSGLLERAVLRHTLELHSAELSAAAQWMAAAVRRLGDIAGESASEVLAAADSRALGSLTAREMEVLSLLARGLTNRQIAQKLVVREGTVKYHVKNVLRKLGAAGRADATSRYIRSTAVRTPG
jgi:DNA-binding CsgD family transcriptional regulator